MGRQGRNERRRGRAGKLLTVDRSVEGRARNVNWHGATGVWMLPMLLFLSATGITWSTYAGAHVTDVRTAVELGAATTGYDGFGTAADDSGSMAAVAQLDSGSVDCQRSHRRRRTRAGVHAPLEITLPAAPGERPGRHRARQAVSVDHQLCGGRSRQRWRSTVRSTTGATTRVIAKLADWGIRMHMGFLFGWLNQLVLFGVAVGAGDGDRARIPDVVAATGRPGDRGGRSGDRPARAGARGMHPAAMRLPASSRLRWGGSFRCSGSVCVAFLVVDR